VSVAVGRGAEVLPYRWHDGAEAAYADQHGALLADRTGAGPWSLSPVALARLPAGSRLVLPSPNGSALAFGVREHAPEATVLAGCLRNASAVARAAREAAGDGHVAVIAAGERWNGTTGPLRPAVEDLLGAGAVLEALGDGSDPSPEARAARAAVRDARGDLEDVLLACASGRELVERHGLRADVEVAAALDADRAAPALVGTAFVAA
jgi:2-phosphosulfolactate phosphatase